MRSHFASAACISALLSASAARADEPGDARSQGPLRSDTPAGPVVDLAADDHHATIEKRSGTSSYVALALPDGAFASVGHWQQACVAPCSLRLDPRFSYRVAGDGLVPTDSFTLPQGADRVRVDAKMGSTTKRLVGILLTGAGAAATAAGGLALGATPILESEDVGSKTFRTGMLIGGASVLTLGVFTLTTGLYLWLSSGSNAQVAQPARAGARLAPNGFVF